MDKETRVLIKEAIKMSDKLIAELRWQITKRLFIVFGLALLDIRNFQGQVNLLFFICPIICGIGIGAEIAQIVIIGKRLSVSKDVNKVCKKLKGSDEK